MNAEAQLAAIKEEIARIETGLDPIQRDDLLKSMSEERDAAISRAERAEAAQAKVQGEMDALKRSIQWVMAGLQIKDLFALNFSSDEVQSSAEGWLPLTYCPDDTKRLEWINAHGRTSVTSGGFLVVLPVDPGLLGEETVPEIYNIRAMIDVARKLYREK